MKRLLAWVVLWGTCAHVLSGCAATDKGFLARHTDGAMWRRGAREFGRSPEQWVPPLALAVATPIAWVGDKDTSEDSVSQQIFNSNTRYGDQLAIGLLVAPAAIGGYQALGGDSRLLETSAESIAFTMFATYGLKLVVNRERPDGSSQDSFPSGHTSAAFAGATLLQREFAREFDDPWWSWLGYLPATYVGVSRLEGQRHYLADILFGAALGMTITNITWNAHFGHAESRDSTVRFAPVVGPGVVGLGLDISF